jgi:hypothetical protein
MPFGLLLFITINHDRQAPGQARLAKLSAERSAGTVSSFCSRRTLEIRRGATDLRERATGLFPVALIDLLAGCFLTGIIML